MRKRIIVAALLALLSLVFYSTPALAIDVPATSPYIVSVNVYGSYVETDDQLWVVQYAWPWGTYPTDYPAETATQAAVVRIIDSGVEIGRSTPKAYYRNGWDDGIVAIYFSSADAPTWNGGTFDVTLEGNPLLTWSGGSRPVAHYTAVTWATDHSSTSITSAEVYMKVVSLGNFLSQQWGATLLASVGGSSFLASAGDAYFSNVIPYLSTAVPDLYSISILQPGIFDDSQTGTSGESAIQSGIAGTVFDFGAGNILGMPASTVEAGIIVALILVGALYICHQVNNFSPAMILIGTALILFASMGALPLRAGIACGLFGGLLFVFGVFYEPASA